jgi:hypothetical protein
VVLSMLMPRIRFSALPTPLTGPSSCCLLRNRKLPYRLVAANPSQDMPGKNMLISSLVKQCFQASPSKLAHEHRPKLLRRSSDLCPFTHRC